MRLKRILLFALMSVLVASGCTANRHRATSLTNDIEPVVEPPRHDHEYSPSLTPEHDEFRDPPESRGPKEPVPAPPALGVSRVKSVSWLKDLGTKLHGPSRRTVGTCPDLGCSDEELVGKCSVIEPCVPDSACASQNSRFPYEARGGGSYESSKRVSPMSRFRKSVSRVFHKPKPRSTSNSCGIGPSIPDACGATIDHEFPSSTRSLSTPETPAKRHAVVAPSQGRSIGSNGRKKLLTEHKKECLAEPLIDSVLDEENPGLIGPTVGQVLPRNLSPAPIVEAPLQTQPGGVPAEPQITEPLDYEHAAPDTTPPQSPFVEPPLWPKLAPGGSLTSVSSSVSSSVSKPVPSHPAVPDVPRLPLVIPMSRR